MPKSIFSTIYALNNFPSEINEIFPYDEADVEFDKYFNHASTTLQKIVAAVNKSEFQVKSKETNKILFGVAGNLVIAIFSKNAEMEKITEAVAALRIVCDNLKLEPKLLKKIFANILLRASDLIHSAEDFENYKAVVNFVVEKKYFPMTIFLAECIIEGYTEDDAIVTLFNNTLENPLAEDDMEEKIAVENVKKICDSLLGVPEKKAYLPGLLRYGECLYTAKGKASDKMHAIKCFAEVLGTEIDEDYSFRFNKIELRLCMRAKEIAKLALKQVCFDYEYSAKQDERELCCCAKLLLCLMSSKQKMRRDIRLIALQTEYKDEYATCWEKIEASDKTLFSAVLAKAAEFERAPKIQVQINKTSILTL